MNAKKEYLSLYLLQNEKIRRLKEMSINNPEKENEYMMALGV